MTASSAALKAWLPFGVRGGWGRVSPSLAFALGVGVSSLIWGATLLPAMHREAVALGTVHRASAGIVAAIERLHVPGPNPHQQQ